MAGIDSSREFVPLKIAVLTISDTRALEDDKSGATLAERIEKAGHVLAARAIVRDEIGEIRAQVERWIADPTIDVVITTGGTGVTGRDVTPYAIEPLFEKRMDAFATMFLLVSQAKIGTSAIQTRATAGIAGATYVFCLPGSPGACRDAWDEILVHQLDYRYRPCNFVEILPRLDEHLRRAKAKGATVYRRGSFVSAATDRTAWRCARSASLLVQFEVPRLGAEVLAEHVVRPLIRQFETGSLVDAAGSGEDRVGPQRQLAVAHLACKAHRLLDQSGADAEAACPRLDQKEPQPSDFIRLPHQQDGPDVLARPLRNPAALTLAIMVADEACNDFSNQRFEPLVPAVFLPIERAMAGNDPAHVAGTWRPQQVRDLRCRDFAQRTFDGAHGGNHAFLIRNR